MSPEEQRAEQLLAEGRGQEAAQVYLQLAETARGEQATDYVLLAAEAKLSAGDVAGTRTLLAERLVEPLLPTQAFRRDILAAEIQLEEGRPVEAISALQLQPPEDADPKLIARFHEVRARGFDATGNQLQAARERVWLDALLADPGAQVQNRHAIWNTLTQLTPEALDEASRGPPDAFVGWVSLAAIAARSRFNTDTLTKELESWRRRFVQHPAEIEIVPELLETSVAAGQTPTKVALLLPLSGRLGRAATAIREGFVTAWYADAANAERPMLLIRDSNNGLSPNDLVASAVNEGAEFIVGPLRKDAVSALTHGAPPPVPILTLNQNREIPGDDTITAATIVQTETGTRSPALGDPNVAPVEELNTHSTPEMQTANPTAGATAVASGFAVSRPIYQFALSPEGEAEQVAVQAWNDGHKMALVLTPNTGWGERVATAFAKKWETLGGIVAEQQSYGSKPEELSGPVKQLMNVDESERRLQRLRSVLQRKVEHETSRRKDADFVFMAAFPRVARQLRPLLFFYHASKMPVYSTSHVYTGTPDEEADSDLEGVRFADMPWILDPDAPQSALRAKMNGLSDTPASFLRLYAFGIDAYRLVSEVWLLDSESTRTLPGATGTLTVDNRQFVRRDLVWAEFKKGLAEPILVSQ